MAAPSFITITAMERSPTSPPRPVSRTKADGQPAQDGLTTIRMAGSTWSSPITSSGRRRRTCGAANAGQAIVLTAIRATTKRSEEHTSELQSQSNLVCRLLLEKKKKPGGPRSLQPCLEQCQVISPHQDQPRSL